MIYVADSTKLQCSLYKSEHCDVNQKYAIKYNKSKNWGVLAHSVVRCSAALSWSYLLWKCSSLRRHVAPN